MKISIPIQMRKIVPVAAMISAGKSQLLNTLYNIDFLECKAGIGTKFVNILRYNPSIKEPIFFHLLVKKDGEKYIFYKDNSQKEIVGSKRITDENKRINEILSNKNNVNYENIFYMTEINESPFITDKDYLLTHDLCDIPGLSEYQEEIQTYNENKIEKKDIFQGEMPLNNDFGSTLIALRKELGIIPQITESKNMEINYINDKSNELSALNLEYYKYQNQKEEDDIYYNIKLEKNSYINEIFNIIKDYIDGGIIILSIEKYYFKENYELIAMLHKIIKKKIDNFLIILNKMDLSKNPNEDIKKCKGYFCSNFPSFKTFNINLNKFVPLSTKQLKNELLMGKNFKYLLLYHFYNYINKISKDKNEGLPIKKSFIDHLKDLINSSGKMNKEEIKQKINESALIDDEEIINIIRELKDEFKGEDIIFGIEEKDFREDYNEDEDDDDEINPSYIIKLLYVYQKENKLIPPLSKEIQSLLDYFNSNNVIDKSLAESQVLPNNFKELNGLNWEDIDINKINANKRFQTVINKQIIAELMKVTNKIENFEFIDEIKNIMEELFSTINFLKIYDVIFIPFLGPSNSGKSTIINNIIGEDVLHTDLNECTKKGIIIRYSDEEITLKKAILKKKESLGETDYFFYSDEEIIATGLKNVKETIKGINYKYTDKEEDSFYFIKTKIKLFDELGFDDSLKNMIYLIDFPGYGTNNIFEKQLYQKVMKICNTFIFVVRNSLIKEKMNKNLFDNLFSQAMRNKLKLPSGFIKSCLFIFNNDHTQTTTNADLQKAKKDIRTIIKRIPNDNINACFFNAKYYENYLDYYNTFFYIKRTIINIYKNYRELHSICYKYPEKYGQPPRFDSYLYTYLKDKIKSQGFEISIKEIIPNDKIKEEVNKTIDKLIKDEITDQKRTSIQKIITFAREKMNYVKIYKESNIEIFKKAFLNQINNINDEMQAELFDKIKKNIENLDYLFSNKFSERKSNLKYFEDFKKNIEDIRKNFENLLEDFNTEMEQIKKNYLFGVRKSLERKKNNIKTVLEKKEWTQFQDELFQEIKAKTEKLNKNIQNLLEKMDNNSNELYDEAKKKFKTFNEGQIKLNNYKKFKQYFSNKVANKDVNIENEINKEINLCTEQGYSKIWEKKNFFSLIASFFSRVSYLTNIIEIIIEVYDNQIYYILYLLKNNFSRYINFINKSIKTRLDIVSVQYMKIQEKNWENICKMYAESKKTIINYLKSIEQVNNS